MNSGNKDLVYTVIGAGNGGQAMAGHLAISGFKVRLYNRSAEKLKEIKEYGGIYLEGKEEGFGRLSLVTDDIKDAVENSDVIMVTVPASGHRDIARLCIPHLKEGQVIILNPGRTGGALEFLNIMKHENLKCNVIIAETQTFIYACRAIAPGRVKIFSIKKTVSMAAVPSNMTEKAIAMVSDPYPQFVAADNVLETSLNNVGAVFHPGPTLLNSGRIESTGGNFEYYIEGITPTVSRILEQIDTERVKVAKALGIKAVTALEWLKISYGSQGVSLYDAVQDTSGYAGIKAPGSMDTRYIFEDVPESLVPISAIAATVGVRTPTIDSIIHLACAAHNRNYYSSGRNTKNLGIEGLTAGQLIELVTYGAIEQPEEVVA